MAKFEKGDSVIFVENNEVGIVVDVLSNRGKTYYEVRWIKAGDVTYELESRLEPERKLDSPFDRLAAGVYSSFFDFSRLNTQYKIENTSINTISTLKASRTIFKPYQYKPLLKFLNSDIRRVLIADEVGLGKTIEAGHILLELIARKELNSALIVCPKSLKDKWKAELEKRFDLHFKNYESKSDLLADIDSHRPLFGIVTYRAVSETGKRGVFEALDETSQTIDMLICDEAHSVRNFGTDQTNGVTKLLSISKAALFMTATPVMTSKDNLYTLLHLLDEDQFRSLPVFYDLLNANKPFVKALSQINRRVPFKEIASQLKESQVSYIFKVNDKGEYEYVPYTIADDYKDNPLFNRIITDLETKEENDQNRVRIQNDLSSINLLNSVLTRTTKRDVTTDWCQAIRDSKTVTIELTEAEVFAHDEYIEDYFDQRGEAPGEYNPLVLSGVKKKLASSIIAYTAPWRNMKGFPTDSKYNQLLKVVHEVVDGSQKKLIVFATQIETLEYIEHRLGLDGYKTVLIHGSIKDRTAIIDRFHFRPDINILLSSEVGGEGLDMQFCDTMVNYDLPWNPMVVEQRIGRIDRFGQKSKFVHIYNLLVMGTLQEKIYGRLLSRIGIFKECIGDLEAILDGFLEKQLGPNHSVDFSKYLEQELDSPGITDEEIERKLDSMRKAIEQVKFDAEKLGNELTDSLTNDMYFKEEISRIQETGRYITEKELINYLQGIIENVLRTCRLAPLTEKTFKFSILKTDPKVLVDFLIANQPATANTEYKEFINSVRDVLNLEFTFEQEYAFEHPGCIYINAYHPIVQAITEYYKKTQNVEADTFKLSLPSGNLGKKQLAKGEYILGVYLIEILRELFHTNKHVQILVPVVYDCAKNEFMEDRAVADLLFAQVQSNASMFRGATCIKDGGQLQLEFTERIAEIQEEFKQDYTIRAESSKLVLRKRTKAMHERRIENQKRLVWEAENTSDEKIRKMIHARRGKLKSLKDEMERDLAAIDSNRVSVRPSKLISLTYLSIG